LLSARRYPCDSRISAILKKFQMAAWAGNTDGQLFRKAELEDADEDRGI